MRTLSVLATSALLTFGAVAPSFAAPTKAVVVQSQVDVNQAISIAKQKAQGKVKSVDFDKDDSEYEVELATISTKYEVKIDARTGKVNSQKQERIKTKDKDADKYKALNTAKVDLAKAMQIAASSGNGQAVDAEFDIEKGTAVYEVKTVKNGQEYEVVIDANTGRVIQTKRD